MTRQFGILLLSLISCLCLAQNLNYDDWTENPVNHKFSKLSVWRYNLDTLVNQDAGKATVTGNPEFDDTTLFSVEHYNKDGYLIRTKGYNG